LLAPTPQTARFSPDRPRPETLQVGEPEGALAPVEIKESVEAFRFVVGGVARASALEPLPVRFDVRVDTDAAADVALRQSIELALDLDTSGGSGPTTFFEGFESGFGSFTTMHLDQSLNPPDDDPGNREQGLANADGTRCQYQDPDWPDSLSSGTADALDCFQRVLEIVAAPLSSSPRTASARSRERRRVPQRLNGASEPFGRPDDVRNGTPAETRDDRHRTPHSRGHVGLLPQPERPARHVLLADDRRSRVLRI
jgi:hypothetical protein